MKNREFPMGMKVSELKAAIKNWPDVNSDGSDAEVWITTGFGLSSPCMALELLNYRKEDDGKESADMLLTPSNYVEEI